MDKFFQIGTITCATSTPAVSWSVAEFPGHRAKVKNSSPIFHLFLSEISSAFIREETLQRSLPFMLLPHMLSHIFIYWTCPMSISSPACLVLNASNPPWENTSRIWHVPLRPCFHRITEKLRLEGTTWRHLSFSESGTLGLVIQGPVKPNLEYSQWRRFHHFSEQPFLILNCSHREYYFLISRWHFSSSLVPIASCPVAVHPCEGNTSLYLYLPL